MAGSSGSSAPREARPPGIATSLLTLLGAFAFLATVYATFTLPMNQDEMEHLHATYLMLRGQVPYIDFWQNHAPPLWLALVPVMSIWPENASICYVARGIGMVQALAIFFLVARLALLIAEVTPVGPARTRLLSTVAVAYWGAAIPAELSILRPDGPMIICILLAALFAVGAERNARARSALFAGLFIGLGVSFSLKLLLLVVAFPIATLIRTGISFTPAAVSTLVPSGISFTPAAGVNVRRWIRTNAVYAAGLTLGVLPLAVYLVTTQSLGLFYRWVVEFNAARGGSPRAGYDLIWVPVLLGLFALLFLPAIGHPRRWRSAGGVTVRVMFGLVILASIFLFPLRGRAFPYYLAPLVTFGAIFVGADIWNLASLGRRARLASALFATAILATASFSTLPLLWSQRDPEDRLRGNLEFVQWMIDAARHQTVQCDVAAHPIYAYDLTPFYVPWQAFYTLKEDTKRSAMLRDLLRDAGRYEDMLREKEPVLLSIPAFQRHMTVLQRAGLIDDAELGRVQATIQRDYRNFNDVLYVRRPSPSAR